MTHALPARYSALATPRAPGGARVPVSLACSECKSRNYKTTRAHGAMIELKKYCKTCGKHTLHREAK